MKKRILIGMLFILMGGCGFLLGNKTKYKQVNTDMNFNNDYINMEKVINFETTENGLLLHFKDGTGYYWER